MTVLIIAQDRCLSYIHHDIVTAHFYVRGINQVFFSLSTDTAASGAARQSSSITCGKVNIAGTFVDNYIYMMLQHINVHSTVSFFLFVPEFILCCIILQT